MKRVSIALVMAMGCTHPTEVVLEVETDIAGVDAFVIDAIGTDGATSTSRADLRERLPPRILVLHHAGGGLGPIRVTARAERMSMRLAEVQREVDFEDGVSKRLRVVIADACRTTACTQACGNDGQCRPLHVERCEYIGRVCDAGR